MDFKPRELNVFYNNDVLCFMSGKSKATGILLFIVIIGGLTGILCFFGGLNICTFFLGDNINNTINELKPGTKDYPYIRVNQFGYFNELPKYVFIQTNLNLDGEQILLKDFITENVVSSFSLSSANDVPGYGFDHVYFIDFSSYEADGTYYFEILGVKGPSFTIGNYSSLLDVAEDSLNFLWINQDGTIVPGWHGAGHLDDGIIANTDKKGVHVNMTKGWVDAGDYIKFTKTISETMIWLLMAGYLYPDIFIYNYSYGKAWSNIPFSSIYTKQVLFGLEYLYRCVNVAPERLVIMVANASDHAYPPRMPEDDPFHDRPVYLTEDGEGANIAAKIGTVFAIASLEENLPVESIGLNRSYLIKTSEWLYNFSLRNPTLITNDFYPEASFIDDLALTGYFLYITTKNDTYLKEAFSNILSYFKEISKGDYDSSGFSLATYFLAKEYLINASFVNSLTNVSIDELVSKLYYDLIWMLSNSKKDSFHYIWDYYFWGSGPTSMKMSIYALMLSSLNITSLDNKGLKRLSVDGWNYNWGINPWGYSFITGYGWRYPTIHHHQISYLLNKPIIGAFALGGTNIDVVKSNNIPLPTNDPLSIFQTDKAVFYPTFDSYVNNEPTIETNSFLFFASLYIYFSL